MHTLIIKDSRIVYADPALFNDKGTWAFGAFDPTTHADNAATVQVESLPTFFVPGRCLWDGGQVIPAPDYAAEILPGIKADKAAQINAGCDAALAASITMPSRQAPPSTLEVVMALERFKADDPENWETLRAVHLERRSSLLAALDNATSISEVDAIKVTYAV